MKKVLFVSFMLLLCIEAQAQLAFSNYFVINSGTSTKADITIKARSFTSSTCDTTYGLDISQFGTVQVALQTLDSATILVYSQLSLDNSHWQSAKLQDSLKQTSDGDTVKAVDFSTVALGCKYVRWIFKFSGSAYACGVMTPNYTAIWKAKQ